MTRPVIFMLLLVSMSSLDVGAQEPAAKLPVEGPIEQPITLNGQRPFLNPKSEFPNSVSAGVGLETIFDDNPDFATADKHSNVSQVLWPYVRVTHTGSRLVWDLGVDAMLVTDLQIKTENIAQESVQLNLSYRLAPYVTLRASSEFANSSGLFSDFNGPASGSGIGLVEQPSLSLFIPSNQRTISTSNLLEVDDQISPRGVVGARGIYSLVNYPNVARSSQFGPLPNNRSYAGEGFYNYQLSAKHWIGVMLRAEKFDTKAEPSVSADSALLLYAFKPTQKITLSVFAGPERFDAPVIADTASSARFIRNQGWTTAAGGTAVWQGAKFGALGEVSRGINEGGGLSYTATGQMENAQVWRRLGSSRELEFGFTHSQGRLFLSNERFFGTLAGARFEQRLIRNLTAAIGYERDWERYLAGQPVANANRAWISLSYGITRPLGK